MLSKHSSWRLTVGTLALLCCADASEPVQGQADPPLVPPAQSASPQTVPADAIAARVGPISISVRLVDFERRRMAGKQVAPEQVPAEQRALTEARALQQLVDRTLVLQFLDSHDLGPSNEDVKLEVQRVAKKLAARDLSLEQHLNEQNLSRQDFAAMMRWELGQLRLAQQYVTDENMQRYFERSRRDFDGTKLRVAHILWKLSKDDEDARQAARAEASEVRHRLQGEKLSWEEAARQFSDAPSADQAGDIGWIERREPMPESFSKAAFELEKGEISQPVATPFGIHLIRVLEQQPGDKTLDDPQVRQSVRQAVHRYVLRYAIEEARKQVEVDYTGQSPYFDPETHQLVN